MSKIDVHAHVVPPAFRKALQNAGGDPAGWTIPQWTADSAIELQDALGIKTSVLSVTSPGCIFLDEKDNRELCRKCNEFCAQLRTTHPGRFGFYGNLSNPKTDLSGCLTEIDHCLDSLGADGICLMTQYDGYYLGHPDFIPLWEELDRRKTNVLIHPTPPDGYKPMPGQKYCPCPIFDFCNETTRTVCDLIMSGRRHQFPNVNIVLCHGGGTIPFLADRIAYLANAPAFQNPLSPSDIIDQFKTFHYDTASCGTSPAFDLTLAFVPEDKLLFGTDHPYAAPEGMMAFVNALEGSQFDEGRMKKVNESNALALFPRLR